jgi:hypothetical protein
MFPQVLPRQTLVSCLAKLLAALFFVDLRGRSNLFWQRSSLNRTCWPRLQGRGRSPLILNTSNSWDPNSWIDPISNRAFEIQEIRCKGFKLTKHIKPPFYWDHFAISPWPWPQVNFLTRKIGSWSDWAGCRWSKHHHHHPRDGKLQTYMTTYPSTLPHCGSKSKSVIAISSRWNPLKA